MNTYAERLEASLSRQIRVELTERGMEQKDLADAVGIEAATLSRYLKGHRSIPLPTFFKVAESLDVAPHVLLQRADARLAG
ncbi:MULTISPECIES: helix-turn-helix transcriptional regulator [unclassified Arthrobacter]|uniref:helix-turn-helix domain-containing protein n=1 Tax=unclassified Arthrobacter TaxID=235627 RepID=UPI002499D6D4|nr:MULTISPECIES: helix-turn-helix transcriptional regulator [unclassified Arthrobacter]MDI3241648.1 helix-turn-helix transcriptional regulator [Arthrobacter sp. AL05]